MMKEWKNQLYYGDNLTWLRDHDAFPNESIDLIYLDPPFNSKADYNVIFTEPGGKRKSQAQIQAFDDSWHWEKEAAVNAINELNRTRPDIAHFIDWLGERGDKKSTSTAAYLSMMAVRLIELHRVLKPTGSLYLHCDPTASHYLKVLLDSIFGTESYNNEIIWKRTTAHNTTSRRFGYITDSILFYAKTGEYTFHPPRTTHNESYTDQFYRFNEPNGKQYRLHSVERNPALGIRPNLIYEYSGFTPKFGWMMEKGKLEQLDKEGRLTWSSTGRPLRKIYLDDVEQPRIGNLWDDISFQSLSKERLGYPTQKPLPLLERIIQASSNEGDIVLDPFCGCGTTIAAAQKLNRKWIGIDVTWLAIDLIEKQRLVHAFGPEIKATYTVKGQPVDEASAEALARKNKKEFEIWAISLVGAQSRERDGGVDGIFGFTEKGDRKKVLVQVKGGERGLNPGMVRDLIGTVKKEDAAIGLMITLIKPTIGMLQDAAHSDQYYSELWDKSYPSIQIRTVGELLAGKDFDLPPSVENPMKKATRIKDTGKTEKMI